MGYQRGEVAGSAYCFASIVALNEVFGFGFAQYSPPTPPPHAISLAVAVH